jgi:3-isopropylmalate/(R)-2-methylmalate dehydratase large subunit
MMSRSGGRTLYDKIIDAHTVRVLDGSNVLVYVDRHLLNEYTSPQAFTGLREAGRKVWRPEHTFAVVDHVNPTDPRRARDDAATDARAQINYFSRNCREFGVELFDVFDSRQGIEHVTFPEQGLIQPGMIVVCGDSHTTTHGALGALGFGIGTSEVEHALATQTLVHRRLGTFRVMVEGALGPGVTAKDLVMGVIERIGASGAVDHVVEFDGPGFRALSVEGRMTVCNMIVEGGARAVVTAPDKKVFDYVRGRPRAPRDACWERALAAWASLKSDPDAEYDNSITIDAGAIEPLVTWGTSPDQVVRVTGRVPDPAGHADGAKRHDAERALAYMGLAPGMPMEGIRIDQAFIGSCTNGRIEDLREAARVVNGRKVAEGVRAVVVPGSQEVKRAAEREGLAEIFISAGFEWHNSGCSLCLAMNGDLLPSGKRCASSTNRNFEGRQGVGGRTHLMSPAMVAAAAIRGEVTDIRKFSRA